MKNWLILILAAGASALAVSVHAAEPLPAVAPVVVPLWPDASSNNPAEGPRPTMEIYTPFTGEARRTATVVILPGGGYSMLSPYERLFAEYFRSLGYTAVVVNYRLKPHLHPAAYADATRAIRLLRSRGSEWNVPAARLALLGGSAGGHLAALVATRPDFYHDPADDLAATVSARPDRLILAYPVISATAPYRHRSLQNILPPDATESTRAEISPERHVSKDTPPTFIFHAADDTNVSVENSVDFARACWAAGVPAELHVFPRGGHGRMLAYDPEVSPRWRELLREWLATWK